MNNSVQYDVIIIGAGVMGSSTAYQSAKQGLKTLLVEQFDFLHHRGSSHGESRTIRATYPESYYPPLVIQSENLWRSAESDIGYSVFSKSPQLDIGPADNRSLLSVISNCENLSIPHQILNRRETSNRFSINIPDDWIGIVTELGGVVKPTKAVAMFQTLAVKYGAVVKDKTEIINIEKDEIRGGVIITSELGFRFWGKKCVLTAGAWVSKLVKKVSNNNNNNSKGIVLPIQPVETSVFYWKINKGKADDFSIESGFPSFASYGEPYIYGTPVLEFPDLIKIAVHGGRECDPDKRTWGGSEGTARVIGHLKEWIRLTFGERIDWEEGPVMSQSCLYSMTPDEDYIIDFLGGEFGEDVVVAGGFSGHGFKMAPVVGRLLVDLVVGGKAAAVYRGEELKYFKVGRFEGDVGGNVKGFEDQVRFK